MVNSIRHHFFLSVLLVALICGCTIEKASKDAYKGGGVVFLIPNENSTENYAWNADFIRYQGPVFSAKSERGALSINGRDFGKLSEGDVVDFYEYPTIRVNGKTRDPDGATRSLSSLLDALGVRLEFDATIEIDWSRLTSEWLSALWLLLLTITISGITFAVHKIKTTRKVAKGVEGEDANPSTWMEVTKAVITLGLGGAALLGIIGFPNQSPKPGLAWGVPIATTNPEALAKANFEKGSIQLLTFRACANDDACGPVAPGIQQDLQCYSRYPLLTESDGHDWLGGKFVVNPNNIKSETRDAAWKFSFRYNSALIRLIEARDGPCMASRSK